MGAVMLHWAKGCSSLLFQERFESLADHLGMLFSANVAPLAGVSAIFVLKRDASSDHRQRLKRGIGLDNKQKTDARHPFARRVRLR